MRRNRLAALLALSFMVAFCLCGITAQTTVGGQSVSVRFSVPYVLYTLSSAATLLLVVVFLFMVFAAVSYWTDQRNIGTLLAAAGTLLFIVFLIGYCCENQNSSLYAALSTKLRDQGIRFKKRDVIITVMPEWSCYSVIALGLCTIAAAFPSLSSKTERYRLRLELEPYLFIFPHVFLFVIFSLIPSIYGLYTAFTKWNLYDDPAFTGLQNLTTILFNNQNTYYHNLRNGLWNTIKFVILSVPFCIVVPLGLALGMRSIARGNKFFQAIFYLPSLMSASTVMLAWEYFFKPTYGMMNNFFMSAADWYTPPYSWIMVILITVWWCNGANMVIYQSALAGVPTDYYEAAAIDGANSIQSFLHITLPCIRYPMSYTLVTTVISQFNVYAQPDMLLGYSNSEANAVLMMYVKDTAFGQGVAGIASAMALILGLIIMVLSSVQIRLLQGKGGDAK